MQHVILICVYIFVFISDLDKTISVRQSLGANFTKLLMCMYLYVISNYINSDIINFYSFEQLELFQSSTVLLKMYFEKVHVA